MFSHPDRFFIHSIYISNGDRVMHFQFDLKFHHLDEKIHTKFKAAIVMMIHTTESIFEYLKKYI